MLFTGRQSGEQWHLPALIPISVCHTHFSLCLALVHASDKRSLKTIEIGSRKCRALAVVVLKYIFHLVYFTQKAKHPQFWPLSDCL